MLPFDDTGATLTTDVLAAWPTGNPAGPDAEKRALPAFFAFATNRYRHSYLSVPMVCC
jgi:hypothetical protein